MPVLLAIAVLAGSQMATTLARPQNSSLTFGQLEQLWIKNGGSPTWAPTMAAVALVESGGKVSNLNNNPSTKDYSVGLWQINYYGNLNSGRTAAYGPSSLLNSNADANAKAAVNLLGNGSGITNWEGDPVGAAVIANGGQPLTASQAQSVAAGKGGFSGSSTAGTTGTVAAAATSSCGGSSTKLAVGPFTILNACQLKAVKGGALALAGGTLLLVGVVAIIARTGIGKKAVEATGAGLVYSQVTKRRAPSPSSSSSGGGTTRQSTGAVRPQTTKAERDYETARETGRRRAELEGPFPDE